MLMLSFTVFTICLVGFIWTLVLGVKCCFDYEDVMGTYEEMEFNGRFIGLMFMGGLFGVLAFPLSFIWTVVLYPIVTCVWLVIALLVFVYID